MSEDTVSTGLGRRCLISIAGLAALELMSRVSLLSFTPTSFLSLHSDPNGISLAAIGLVPFVSSFMLVEWVALLIPPLRKLRETRDGRRSLIRASVALGVVLALVQGHALGLWGESVRFTLSTTGLLAEFGGGLSFGLVMTAAVTLGSVATLGLALWVSRRGLGNGFSLILVMTSARDVLNAPADTIPTSTLFDPFVLAIAVIAFVTLHHGRKASANAPNGFWFVLPAAGVVPLTLAAAIVALSYSLSNLGVSVPEVLLADATTLRGTITLAALTTVLSVVLGLIFYSRSAIRTTFQRYGIDGTASPRFPIALSAVVMGIVCFAEYGSLTNGSVVTAATIFVWVAVALDVWNEYAFRREHGALEVHTVLHRVLEVPLLLAELDRAKRPALARGFAHRSLLHFFGPYIPIEVLVPTKDRANAAAG